jgi:hypothetical protein
MHFGNNNSDNSGKYINWIAIRTSFFHEQNDM